MAYGEQYRVTPLDLGDSFQQFSDARARNKMQEAQREVMRQQALAEYGGLDQSGQLNRVALFQPIQAPQGGNPLGQAVVHATIDQGQAARAGAPAIEAGQHQPFAGGAAAAAPVQAQAQAGPPVAPGMGSPAAGPIQGPPEMNMAEVEKLRGLIRNSPQPLLARKYMQDLGFTPGTISNLMAAAPLNPGSQQELYKAGQNGFTGIPTFAAGTHTPDAQREAEMERRQDHLDYMALNRQARQGNVDFSRENQLRDEFNTLSKPMQTILPMFRNIKNAALNPNPSAQSDMSMIFAYMKILDPSSTVREGEYATAANAGSSWDKLGNLYNKVLDGQKLQPDQRTGFYREAKSVMQNAATQQAQHMTRYSDLARRSGVNPNMVTYDYLKDLNLDGEDTAGPGPGPGPGAGGPAAQKTLPPDTKVAPPDAPEKLRGAWSGRLSPADRQKVLFLRSKQKTWPEIMAALQAEGKIR